MKRRIIVLISILSVATLAFAQTSMTKNESSTKLQTELLKIIDETDDAFMTRDSKVLEGHLAENYLHVNPPGGALGRANFLSLPKVDVRVTRETGKVSHLFKKPAEGRMTIERSDFRWLDLGDAVYLVVTETITAEPQ